jgi:hypothetical protein
MRLHTLMAPDGTPRAMALTSPKASEREICLQLLARVNRHGPLTVIADKGYAGREFERDAQSLGALIVRSRRKDEPRRGPHLAPIRQRIESIYCTAKDVLTTDRPRRSSRVIFSVSPLRSSRRTMSSCGRLAFAPLAWST